MSKKGGKLPKTPDPNVVSQAQTQSNQDTASYNAALNRVNTYTPQGSSTFSQTGTDASGAPIYRQDVTLSPQQQALYDQQQQQNLAVGNAANAMLPNLQSTYSTPMDTSGVPKLFGANDLTGERQQVQDALYNRQAAYLDPQWAARDQSFQSQMANKGIVEGSEAWKNALDDQNRARSFDYAQARNDAVLAGRGEMSALSDIANNTHQQSMADLYSQRAQPMNEFNALRNASQVDMPQFSGPAQVSSPTTDTQGNTWAAFQANLDKYNAQQAGSNNLMSGLFGLGSAAIMRYSDERLKTNVSKIGKLGSGPNVYSYTMKDTGEPQIGVMAQEVEKTQPDAVSRDPNGIRRVNYTKVMAKAMRDGGMR